MPSTDTDIAVPLVLSAAQIEEMPWQPVPRCPGVYDKELHRAGDAVFALIRYEAGAATPGHHRPAAEHHIWLLSGGVTIGERACGRDRKSVV